MITKNEVLEIEEQESGVYVFPNSKIFQPSWALFAYNDGKIELYRKRSPDGALLGKPEVLSATDGRRGLSRIFLNARTGRTLISYEDGILFEGGDWTQIGTVDITKLPVAVRKDFKGSIKIS